MSFQGFYISFHQKLFLLLEKGQHRGQYRLIHTAHLVNFDQPLSTLYIVQSTINFEMFLANSNQETIQTIQFDSYCPHKVFVIVHQGLILFSISNLFKKLNRRQKNLTHIVLNIMIVFNLCCIFQCFRQILIKGQYGLTHVMF